MRIISNEELQSVSGSGWFDDVWDSISNFFGGGNSGIQTVEIVGTRMTEGEKQAYDFNQTLTAARDGAPAGCTTSVSITYPGGTHVSTATLGVPSSTTSTLTNADPGTKMESTCTPK